MECLNFDDCEDTRKGHCLGDREDLDCFVKPDQNPHAASEAGSAEFALLGVPVEELKKHPEVSRMLRTISRLHDMVLGTENHHPEMVEARNILKGHRCT